MDSRSWQLAFVPASSKRCAGRVLHRCVMACVHRVIDSAFIDRFAQNLFSDSSSIVRRSEGYSCMKGRSGDESSSTSFHDLRPSLVRQACPPCSPPYLRTFIGLPRMSLLCSHSIASGSEWACALWLHVVVFLYVSVAFVYQSFLSTGTAWV